MPLGCVNIGGGKNGKKGAYTGSLLVPENIKKEWGCPIPHAKAPGRTRW